MILYTVQFNSTCTNTHVTSCTFVHVCIFLPIIRTSCCEIVPVGPLQTVKHFVLSVITFMILYSSLIPISLIIQLEVSMSM